MKKYNNFDNHMVLLGIIIPFLVFFMSMNVTYAFFTATTKEQKSTTETAVVRISINAEASAVSTSGESNSTSILPGDTLNVTGQVVNAGTTDCFAVIEFEIKVEKADGTSVTPVKEYYTFVDGAWEKIEKTTTGFSIDAGIISATDGEDEIDINFTYKFTGAVYDNSYKNATATWSIRGASIQTVNIPGGATEATEMLMENIGYSETLIYGNSVQGGGVQLQLVQ